MGQSLSLFLTQRAQKRHFFLQQPAFSWLQFQATFVQSGQYYLQSVRVFFQRAQENNHVIEIAQAHLKCWPIHQQVHEMLKSGVGLTKSEGRRFELELALVADERPSYRRRQNPWRPANISCED